MNNSKYKKPLLAAGIISYIIAGLMLLMGFVIVFNLFDAKDLLKVVVDEYFVSGTGPNYYYTIIVIDCFFGCMMNIYSGRVYVHLSKMPILPGGISRSLNSMGIMQVLFGFSVIPAIIIFVVASKLKGEKPMTRMEFEKQLQETRGMEIIALQINQLKEDLANNKITKEEYDLHLNKILEQNAKLIISNGQ